MTNEEPPDPAGRLEAALERIAVAAARPAPESVPAPEPAPAPIDPAIAARLDSLILQLRDALDE